MVDVNAALALAVPLIKNAEGCRLKAYLCPAGVPTIGYGETDGVKLGDVWTQERADKAVKDRALGFLQGVLKSCPQLDLEPPSRLAACTSLAYNIGLANFAKSSVCRLTTAKQYQQAADAFRMWNMGGGKILPGLVSRRELERGLYIN
jgi:lysozyme